MKKLLVQLIKGCRTRHKSKFVAQAQGNFFHERFYISHFETILKESLGTEYS